MGKVVFNVTNTPSGLHNGHKAVIEFGKQLGNVEVHIVENLPARRKYLREGIGTKKYKVDISAIKDDCDALGVECVKPVYIDVPEQARVEAYSKAEAFVQFIGEQLFSGIYAGETSYRYMGLMIDSLAVTRLLGHQGYDAMVTGPEVPFFVLQRFGKLLGTSPIEIFPHIIKNQYGLKESSTINSNTFWCLSDLRGVLNGIKRHVTVGTNQKLIQEVNEAYPPVSGWRLLEATVYEGGFVNGRIEVYRFKVMSINNDIKFVEDIDYYA